MAELVNNSPMLVLFPSTETAVVARGFQGSTMESCWPSVLGCKFYRLIQQLALIESYSLGMYGMFLFFRLNKQVQHKLALCCWFLFSISWGLFAF